MIFNKFAGYFQFGLETYLPEVLLSLLSICFLIQLYYILKQRRLAFYHPDTELKRSVIPVSVIISARNEERNLAENLPGILEQNYPDFEVVVVNDCSHDDSEEVLKELGKKYPRLKVVTVTENDRFKTGKKFALTMGIKAAKNEHLLFTDADCKPASTDWISRMASNFTDGAEIVLGYAPYYPAGNFVNALIRFETIRTGGNYLSYALAGDPYMGVGRNLAYTKTLFFSNKGFASHMHIFSGDDDLFVNENATPDNTAVELNPDAFTFSPAKTTFGALYRQKRRHMGVGKLYKGRHRRMLSLDAITGFLFYVLLAACLIFRAFPLVALSLYGIRLVCQLIIYYKIFGKLNGKNLIWYLPVFDLVYYIYLNIFGLISTFIKTTQWK